MSIKSCYFKCKYEGNLYNFPPLSYTNYERFFKWKEVLRKEDKEKDVNYITSNFKLCKNHFEKYYFTAKNRLTRNAVPTLKLGTSLQQEELLCKFIEENPNIIMRFTSGEEIEKKMITKWKAIGPQLNSLGLERNYVDWAKYLFEVISNLKTKEVVWINKSFAARADTPEIRNKNDFTKLELKILKLWNQRMYPEYSPDQEESDREEYEIEMEDVIEDEDSDSSKYSESSRVSRTSRDRQTADETITFTLNLATGGLKPLLQAANIAPCEAPKQTQLNIKCESVYANNEMENEFDAFGKYVAQQLKNMPLQTALDTRKLFISILRSKKTKILNDSFLEH